MASSQVRIERLSYLKFSSKWHSLAMNVLTLSTLTHTNWFMNNLIMSLEDKFVEATYVGTGCSLIWFPSVLVFDPYLCFPIWVRERDMMHCGLLEKPQRLSCMWWRMQPWHMREGEKSEKRRKRGEREERREIRERKNIISFVFLFLAPNLMIWFQGLACGLTSSCLIPYLISLYFLL